MWIVLDQFSRTLIDAAVANAILLSVVVVLVVFTRQPARRIVLVQAGVYAALIMLPLVAFDLLPRAYPVDWLLRTGLVPPSLVPEPSPMDAMVAVVPNRPGQAPPRRRAQGAAMEWPSGEPLVRVGTLLYLVGVAVGLAWMGLGLWGFRRLVASSVEPGAGRRRAFDDLIADLERSPPHPELRTSIRLRGPAVGGVVRPIIVIPAALDRDDLDPEALRLILLHELAHADRGDNWFNLLAGLAQVFWFFLPHLWWLRGQMRIDQEFLADRKAAGPLGESTFYARWLVGLSSGRINRGVPSPASAGSAAETSPPWGEGGFNTQLLQRVAMLLYCPFAVEGRPPRWFLVVIPSVSMLAALLLSSLRILAPVDPGALIQEARARDPLMRDFKVAELVVVPSDASATGARSYVLPLALPAAFHLQTEIVAARRSLARLRIVRCPLVPDPSASIDAPVGGPKETHTFHLRRGPGFLTASLDGEEFELDPRMLQGVQWLSITPADETVVLREMLITW